MENDHVKNEKVQKSCGVLQMKQLCLPSTSSSPRPKPLSDNCQVCYQQVHGNHFGVDTCRACAAFFRRIFVTHKQTFKCVRADFQCEPIDGKWNCKKCRMEKCFSLGMRPDNIQHDRDSISKRQRTHLECSIPMSLERCLKTPHIALFVHQPDDEGIITYCDLSHLYSKVTQLMQKMPTINMPDASSLEQLSYGLEQIRINQILENVPEMEKIDKNVTMNQWELDLERAGNWIMYFDEFRNLRIEDRLTIFKCIWGLLGRLERIAMTAELRRRKQCGDNHYVYSSGKMLNFENVQIELDWATTKSFDEVQFFFGPMTTLFCNSLISEMVELQPTNIELSFIIANLCFHMTGKILGKDIQTITDGLQDKLADDLHNYYSKESHSQRYSHRLMQLLKINKEMERILYERKEKMYLAEVLKVFKVKLSHPELFQFPT